MTGAMYSAVAGLKSHMNKLNVIGNNVANANTYAFKSGRTTFLESIYNSSRTGSNGSVSSGGVNPAQLGYGCSVGTIDLDMGTQNFVPTGRGLDCMVNGTGFFLVGNKAEATAANDVITLDETQVNTLLLTRLGNFEIDAQGYLTDGQGNVVYGFVTCAGVADPTTGDVAKSATPGLADPEEPAVSTQLVPIRLPLAALQQGTGPTDPAYVKEGTAIFPGVDGTSGFNLYDDPNSTNSITTGKTIATQTESIQIDGKTGKITCVNNADDSRIVIGYIPLASVTNVNGVTHINGPYFQALDGSGYSTVASIGNVLKDQYLNNMDGTNATDVQIFGSGDTQLNVNGLESSGTDIATEFSEMITTQRGYQANTRIITVTDSMLEELVNMKR